MSEVDKVLSGLGYFSAITKEEAGENYIDEIAK